MNDVHDGKDTSPYGKSTSGGFKFLSSEDGLRRAGGCYRLAFGFTVVFWEYQGLNRGEPFRYQKNDEHEDAARLPYLE